jgi:hypothetical protein
MTIRTVPPPSVCGLKFKILGRFVGDPELRLAHRQLSDYGAVGSLDFE